MTTEEHAEKIYTEEDLRAEVKPLSQNAFVRAFQRPYRRWLEKWYAFSSRHGKGADLLQKAFFFCIFSLGVTVWQYLVMTFLPYAFSSLNDGAWGWPNTPVPLAGDKPYILFGDAQGLGYFIAFEIAVFTAQCINFPLQRNITYRSHGNPFVQALWYFIGWILVSVFTSALWGICNCFLVNWGVPDAVTGIGKTLITGLFSMVVFFFIFLVIFPDNLKAAKKARARYERAKDKGVPKEKLYTMSEKVTKLETRARLSEAERAAVKAAALVSSLAMRYFALKKDEGESDAEFEARKKEAFERATAAIEEKTRAVAAFELAKSNQ